MTLRPLAAEHPVPTLVDKIVFNAKILAFTICVLACLSGQFPPAHAQRRITTTHTNPAMTVEDAQQDDNISQLTHQLDDVVITTSKHSDELTRIEEDIAEFKGEERIVAFFLTLLIGSSIILQIRVKKP